MEHAHYKLDWPAVERGVTEHIRGLLAVAVGSPELLKVKCPGFQNPEIPLEQALKFVITQNSAVAEAYGWDERPGLFARTILPWIDYLRGGGYHPLPVSALHHFLTATTVASISDEVVTIVARAEVEYALEQKDASSLRTHCSDRIMVNNK